MFSVDRQIKQLIIFSLQSYNQQEDEGDGGPGAELRQLQPTASQGAAGGTQQLCRGLPKQKWVS